MRKSEEQMRREDEDYQYQYEQEGARYYCPATNVYNLTAAQARALRKRGIQVQDEDEVLLSV